ncbi:MAG TPA: two-component sensor histidine kinase, partial [Acidocella sp.]|nr:two-component sensor histidine kinase [Acidocella sp.]
EAARNTAGSGLGLALVAAVAQLHNGTLHLADNHPGLRAILSLPLRRETTGTKPPAPARGG